MNDGIGDAHLGRLPSHTASRRCGRETKARTAIAVCAIAAAEQSYSRFAPRLPRPGERLAAQPRFACLDERFALGTHLGRHVGHNHVPE
jgi:hypothetical protein